MDVDEREGESVPVVEKEMLLTGAGLTFGTFATLYWAEQYVSSGVGAILSATGPLMIMVMQTALLRQKTSARMIAGCLIGFGGVVLVVLPGVSFGGSSLWLWGVSPYLWEKYAIQQAPCTPRR